ncbi:MAG: type II toxin-antitoxin system RelE/ParE family toxin [Planctomycetota bacterium]|nr:type II toxin-antitoxin system RelE/ParE family toxin [Planctomycetota bacterium]
MKVEVWYTHWAEGHILEISAWWHENRTASLDLFRRELEGAIDLLEQSPDVGRRYPDAGIPGLRRLLLPRTRYHVYYVHQEAAQKVVILAAWSAVRGRGPDLSKSY